MLTSEEVREIELRVAADYACLDAPGFRDGLAARRDVAALLADRAELQAGIERLRANEDEMDAEIARLRVERDGWTGNWERECQRYESSLATAHAEIARLRVVVEAARPVIEWAREHWSDGLLTDEDQARCGEAYRAYAALAALEGEA